MDLQERQTKIVRLRENIAACQRCGLHKTRTHTVPGEGSLTARIMFIGEAPGANEDLQGKPFVGRAGEVLNELLRSVGLNRDDIYICNILKCRPPGNRAPLSTEIKACVGSLDIQIKIIDPPVIATLGNFATTYIFEKFGLPPARISRVAGKVIDVNTPFGAKKIVPLFHPAVATYEAGRMSGLLNDFQVFRKVLEVEPSAGEDILEESYQKNSESAVEENISSRPTADSQLEMF